MKVYLIISAYLILIGTFSRQEEPLSAVANIKIPSNSEKVSRNDISKRAAQKFKHINTLNSNTKSIYIVDNILVTFWDTIAKTEESKKYMKSLKESQLELTSLYNGETKSNTILDYSQIITIGKRQFLIMKTHNGDEYFYTFSSEHKNYKTISGLVQFKKDDKQKADKIFDDLINSITFKQ